MHEVYLSSLYTEYLSQSVMCLHVKWEIYINIASDSMIP